MCEFVCDFLDKIIVVWFIVVMKKDMNYLYLIKK